MVREQAAAASGLCVIIMIVWSNLSFSSRNISSTICEFSVSRFPVGSSAKMIAGPLTTARQRDPLLLAARQFERLMMHFIF